MANDMNIVAVVGRTTREMEVTATTGGTSVGRFSVAVNKKKKQGDEYVDYASFFEVVMYGKLVETLRPYMRKGIQVSISGELYQERWNDSNSGQVRSKVEIVAEKVQLLKGSNSTDSGTKPQTSSVHAAQHAQAPAQSKPEQLGPEFFDDNGFEDDEHGSDVPF